MIQLFLRAALLFHTDAPPARISIGASSSPEAVKSNSEKSKKNNYFDQKTRLIRYEQTLDRYVDCGTIEELQTQDPHSSLNFIEPYIHLPVYRKSQALNEWIGALIFNAPSIQHAEEHIGINAILKKIDDINNSENLVYNNQSLSLRLFLRTAIQLSFNQAEKVMLVEKIGQRDYIVNAPLLSLLPHHLDQILNNNYLFFTIEEQQPHQRSSTLLARSKYSHILLVGSESKKIEAQDKDNVLSSLKKEPQAIGYYFNTCHLTQ